MTIITSTRKVSAALLAIVLIAFSAGLPLRFAFAQDDDYGNDSYASGLDYGSDYSDASSYGDDSYASGLDYGTDYSNPSYGDDSYSSGLDYGNDYSTYPSSSDYSMYPSSDDDYSNYPTGSCVGNCGSTDDYSTYPNSDDYSTYPTSNDDYSTYPSSNDDYSTYPTNDENCGCTVENGVQYSGTTQQQTYSTPTFTSPTYSYSNGGGYSTGGYSTGGGYSVGTSVIASSIPLVTPTPTYHTTTIQQQQPIVIQQQPATTILTQPVQTQPIYINNTNTNTNTNYVPNNTVTVVPVQTAPIQYQSAYTIPTSCSASISPTTVAAGQSAILTWNSSNAYSATISDGIGSVNTNGSLSVYPAASMSYVITVYGQNGQTSTCTAYVNVANTSPYVSLSQIPYTGFDFGAFGDAMYWAVLLSFATAAAYLAIYYRGGMSNLAFATRSIKPVRFVDAVETTPVFEEEVIATPVVTPTEVVRTTDAMSFATASNGAPMIVINRA